MKMMKRWLSCALALVMLLGLVGCGGGTDEGAASDSGSESTGDEIVINYPTFQVGTNTAAPVVAELVNRFNEEYAGQYRIEIEEVPGDANYAERIQVQISSGQLPPVVYGGGYALLDLALEADLVVDLTDVVNADPEWAAMYDNEAWQAANCRDGKIYASSSEGQLIGYFYNKELFDQVGIQPATTWEEFFDNCDKLLAAGITPLAMDTADGAWVSMLLMGAMVATSGDEGLEFMNTKYPTDYNIEPVVNAVAEMQKWYQNYTTLDAVGGAYENAANNFFSGNVAMMVNGCWQIPTMRSEAPDLNWGVSLIPMCDDGQYASAIGGENYAVIEGGNVDGAVDFLNYMMGEAVVTELMNAFGYIAGIDAIAQNQFDGDEDYLVFVEQMTYAKARGPHESWPSISDAISLAFNQVMTETAAPADAAAEAQATIDSVLG